MFKDKETSNKTDEKISGLAPANVPRKLTSRDVALGIGRKATDEELEEHLGRPHGKSIPLAKAVAEIKNRLRKI